MKDLWRAGPAYGMEAAGGDTRANARGHLAPAGADGVADHGGGAA